MNHHESDLQRAVIQWWAIFARTRGLAEFLLYHVPNGGRRDKVTAAIMKGQGVRKGIPDLFLSIPRGGKHGLYIELKALDGRTSDEQDQVLGELCRQGYSIRVCRALHEVIGEIERYLSS